jgi:glycosyltransferase involved in cell wall biosynthesis
MSSVHVVVPDSIDDPARPSGGNAYDRQICRGLAAAGWEVREHQVTGGWPWPDAAAEAALAAVVADVPSGAVLLVDGLIASSVPAVLVSAARRVPLVVLAHMALGERPVGHEMGDAHARELAVLRAAAAVVTTSAWVRERLLNLYDLAPARVHVAEPGVDPAELAAGSPDGAGLLCVAPVAAHKGHDVLLAALAMVRDLPWRCVCVGPVDRDPAFVARFRDRADASGIAARIQLTGARTPADVERAYATADVLVLASEVESYGMVVVEALAHGVPVIATNVGGLPEALGTTADGRRPGVLVPPADPRALAEALRRWLSDAELRHALRDTARERRGSLRRWEATAADLADVLTLAPGGYPSG